MGILVPFCLPPRYTTTLCATAIFSFYLVLFGSGKSACFTPNVAQIWHKWICFNTVIFITNLKKHSTNHGDKK